jgi:hypothetical protein
LTNAHAEILEAEKRPEASNVTGCIDAIAGDRVFGWAWDPQQPAFRIAVRIEVAGKLIATALADQPREDLAANGVGDGAHAFEVAVAKGIPPEKINVFAVCPQTGDSLELTQRPVDGSPKSGGPSEEIRSAVHALYRSQRSAQGQLQSLTDTVEGLRKNIVAKANDGSVASRLETLEVAIARVDGLLRDQAAALDELARRPRDHMSRVLACAAVMLAGAALAIPLWW